MFFKSTGLIVLVMIMISIGCSLGDEAAVRAVLVEIFEAAQRGDIEFALQRLTPENPTSVLFRNLKENDEGNYSLALADRGGHMKEKLKDMMLNITSVIVEGQRAAIECSIEGAGTGWKSVVTAKKVDGVWLLESLPKMPDK